jgi:hypothetical protein
LVLEAGICDGAEVAIEDKGGEEQQQKGKN